VTFEFFSSADMLGKIFWLCAISGTLFFALRLLMMLIGSDGADGDLDFEGSDHAFEVLSITSITAFIMMFGWSGLTCHLQYGYSSPKSILIALGVGVFAMMTIAWLFQIAKSLTSRGSVFNIDDAIGLNAQVYQEIPAKGIGKINVTMRKGFSRELDASSTDNVKIASFQSVKIVKVVDARTVSVRKI
jgi:hypothetical protein